MDGYDYISSIRKTVLGTISMVSRKGNNELFALKTSNVKDVDKRYTSDHHLMMERPQEEVRVLKLLSHPNIVKLIDSKLDEKTQVLHTVLEYVSGGDLFDKMERDEKQYRHMSESEARKYFRQMVAALQHCHEKGVVHLDISLENWLLDSDGNLKLCDFGMAQTLSAESEEGKVLTWTETDKAKPVVNKQGKVGYMSPETFLGKERDGRAADVFSLGVCLFMMLIQRPPFKKPCLSDSRYAWISQKDTHKLLRAWGTSASTAAVELIEGMICAEKDRWTLSMISNHSWLNSDSE